MTTVKSSEDFLERLQSIRVEDDEIMVSFYVTSLFTSIPQDLAVSVIRGLLQKEGLRHPNSPSMEDFIQLLRFCLKTHFTFQGTIYEQIKGMPMGSPISGVIAEAILQELERKAMVDY